MCYKNDTDDNEFIEQVDEKELAAIASTPTDNFMFKIDNFDALQSIKDRLAVRTCNGRFFFYNACFLSVGLPCYVSGIIFVLSN